MRFQMPSLHLQVHVIATILIATLIKQIMDLNVQVNEFRLQYEMMKTSKQCDVNILGTPESLNKDSDGNTQGTPDSVNKQSDVNTQGTPDSVNKQSDVNTQGTPDSLNKQSDVNTQDIPESLNKDNEGNTNKTPESLNKESEMSEKDVNDNEQDDETNEQIGRKQSNHKSERPLLEQEAMYTSVWCHDGTNHMCQFKNLCYNSEVEEFVMFDGEGSVYESITMYSGSLTLDLSSVKGHNTHQITIAKLPALAYSEYIVKWVNETTLVFKRFLPDNIFHIIHDDFLPVYHTIKLITIFANRSGSFDIQMFLFEQSIHNNDIEPIYWLLSRWQFKFKNDYFNEGLVCFRDIFIGLSTTTTWYDYGFTKPQGQISEFKVTGCYIRNAANDILKNVVNQTNNIPFSNYIVLFSRKENRKILNEVELMLSITQYTGLKVINLEYESYTLTDLMTYVSRSRGIIAMHGSLLILSMFLKPGSFVLELFPYAVNPDKYTPYKTLANLPGLGLVYKAWSNKSKDKSVGHPDWPPEIGGLSHLKEQERETILQQSDVPSHLCCNDPSWLYHIYQDTIVDINEVTLLIKSLQHESSYFTEISFYNVSNYHPSKIQNVSCILKSSSTDKNGKNDPYYLNVMWNVPWITTVMNYQNLYYELLVQDLSDKAKSVLMYNASHNNANFGILHDGNYHVWVRAVVSESQVGPYSNVVPCLQ